MLNYLGPNIGPNGPMAAQLPGATPGTMPGGIPRAPITPAPLPPPGNLRPAPRGPAPAIHGAAPKIHPGHTMIAKAIMNHPIMKGINAMANQPPPPPEYGTTTQADGSILLHMKNADGSLGPVVKVLPPIKQPTGPAGSPSPK